MSLHININLGQSERTEELRRRLEAERTQLQQATRSRIRDVREEGAMESQVVRDEADTSEADIQGELELALLEMQGDRLEAIDEALLQLHKGTYGYCLDCGGEIPVVRLRELPFAVRCLGCQAASAALAHHGPMISWRKHGGR